MTDSKDPDSSGLGPLLERSSSGDRGAFDELATRLYGDIHAIAVRELRHERFVTMRPTALAHEAYLRLAALREIRWADRAHFLSMAARITRQVLVDEARRRRADKRDGVPVTLSEANLGASGAVYDALDVDLMLRELEGYDAVAAEIVSLRIFGGLSIEETADVLGLAVATVNRRWVIGKAWLARELTRGA